MKAVKNLGFSVLKCNFCLSNDTYYFNKVLTIFISHFPSSEIYLNHVNVIMSFAEVSLIPQWEWPTGTWTGPSIGVVKCHRYKKHTGLPDGISRRNRWIITDGWPDSQNLTHLVGPVSMWIPFLFFVLKLFQDF